MWDIAWARVTQQHLRKGAASLPGASRDAGMGY